MLAVRRIVASPWVDRGIAAVVVVATGVELWTLPSGAPSTLTRLGGVVVAFGVGVPLAWRRRVPAATFAAIVLTIVAAHWLFPVASQGQGPLTPFLAVLLAAFSLGAYTRVGWTPVVVVALVIPIQAAVGKLDSGFWVASVLFWAMGLLYRQRLLRVSELEGETVQLRRDREEMARAAVASERSRIARELHDVVAHSVSVMTVQAGAARHTLDPSQREMHDALESIETAGREALVELRRLLGILRRSDDEPALAPVPGLGQLDALVTQVRDAGLPTTVSVEGAVRTLPPGVDLAAYRIVQEALTNCLKHARPARASVRLSYGRHELQLEVVDDGAGLAGPGPGTGHGVIGMRERASLYGGTLQAGPRAGGGYAVCARLPLDGGSL